MVTLGDKIQQKFSENSAPKFCCKICDYTTYKKYNYDTHLLSAKHKRVTNGYTQETNSAAIQQDTKFNCICGKTYLHRQGLWRHKKICSKEIVTIESNNQSVNDDEPTDKQILKMLVDNQNGLQNMIMEILKQGVNSHNTNTNTNTNHTNSHNKSFNLQFFLNETCKNAMNITDFVKSIEIELDDLEQVGELGYVEGITNIINKNLNKLDITQRPLHCTDKKREVLYIKDDDKWEKEDDNNPKLRKAVKIVSNKNARKLIAFKDKYPDCIYSYSNKSDQYNKLVVEAMGGHNSNDFLEEAKIIKNIIKTVTIDKDKFIVE